MSTPARTADDILGLAGHHPYVPEIDPAGELRSALDDTEERRQRVLAGRAELDRQIAALHARRDQLDTVAAELEGSVHRYRQRLQGPPQASPQANGQAPGQASGEAR